MIENPIVDEIHRVRQQMLADFGGDIVALAREMQRRTEEAKRAGKQVLEPPVRRPIDSTPPNKRVG